MERSSENPIQVYAAAAANGIIAVSKLVVAGISGSSAMLSEGIHSVADLGNQMLLILGLRRSRKAADSEPFRQRPGGLFLELRRRDDAL